MEFQLNMKPRKNILGLGEPFATQWNLFLLLGLVVYGIYRLTLPMIASQFSLQTRVGYDIPVNYGPSALLLSTMFFAHKRWCFPDIRFVGKIHVNFVFYGVLAVTAIYFVSGAAALWLEQPREPSMAMLYIFKTPTQNVAMIVSLLILPPIVEELAFRHFLFSVLPFKKNNLIACVAIVGTATYFTFVHFRYVYLTTFVELFAIGVVLALARIRSNGLVLSICLHAYAIALALICDQMLKYLQA
jgi:membrane protease YdiL (CAAX protease family)